MDDSTLLLRERWFRSIAKVPYQNEIEVEVKFIQPLVIFLGYQEHDFELRVPVSLQMGHGTIKGVADWVLWDINTDRGRKAFVVIEAKAPNQRLEVEVKAQARSYALGLDAPIYMITDGKRLQIFRRGIQEDICVLNCAISNLPDV